MKLVQFVNKQLILKFSGNDFYQAIAYIKANIISYSYDPKTHIWVAPPIQKNIDSLKTDGWIFDKDAQVLLQPKEEKQLPTIDESLFPKLYPFQKVGVRWFEMNNGTGLLADDMGLGKSCQALSYLKLHPELRPVVIVCPASVKLNWQREITMWTGEEAYILNGMKSVKLANHPFYIINYNILAEEIVNKKGRKEFAETSWIYELMRMNVKVAVADECQFISNVNIRSKAFCKLRKASSVKAFMALSGTPIKNRPSEFFTVLSLLDGNTFNNRWKYNFRYAAPYNNGFGWVFTGASNIEELNELIKPLMLRRMKSDVLKDLPKKRKIIVPMELDELEVENYKNASNEFMEWLGKHIKDGVEIQDQLEKLKQIAYLSKRNSVIAWIKDYLESDKKLVVGVYHKKTTNDLMDAFKKVAVKIDGGVTGVNRQKAVDVFQKEDWCRLIICQILTVPGLTLTAASATATVEFAWTSADHEQFEDRVLRIGTTADSVEAYYLIAENTIDVSLVEMVQKKYATLEKLLDGKEKATFFNDENTDMLKGLIKEYKNKIKK